jgi:hypothetical protein
LSSTLVQLSYICPQVSDLTNEPQGSVYSQPEDLAETVNSQFEPPATRHWYYNSYFTKCDAIPPRFGVKIGGSVFWVSPLDMINREEIDPKTGMCETGITSGGSGPYILGTTFLVNVVALVNVGEGMIEFYSHDDY